MPLLYLLLLLLMATASSSSSGSTPSGSSSSRGSDKTRVILDGDIQLGGLFPIHSSSETGDSKCGRLDSHRGIQRMEAMIFTLDEINRNASFLRYGKHKIEIGGLLFDTCSKDTVALEKALEFVKNSLTHELDGGFVCEYPNGTRLPAVRSGDRRHAKKPIRGVVGGAYSQVSVQVANLLRLFAIPQISYASTSATLSEKTRYEYFARTLPPDTEQAKALADVVGYFNWTFVSTVFSKGEYGEGGIQSFEAEVDKLNVCIAERLLINLEPNKEEMDAIVEKLNNQRRARVVIMFTREDHTEKFLDAVRRANISDHFVWISADGWGKSHVPVANNSATASGALTLEISTGEIPEFNRYYTSLLPEQPRLLSSGSHFTNPFFDEYWRLKFNCLLAGEKDKASAAASAPTGRGSNAPQQPCSKISWPATGNFKQEPKVQFVYDAVYAFAHGLEKVRDEVCEWQPDQVDTKASGMFASCVRNITAFPGKEFFNILINESFFDSAQRKVQFTKNGDGIGTYIIYNYRKNRESSHLDYKPVGEWRKGTGLIWTDDIYWSGGFLDLPISRCTDECGVGQKKLYSNKGTNKEKCCWNCGECQPHQRTNAAGDDCIDCGEDEGPTEDRSACVPLHVRRRGGLGIWILIGWELYSGWEVSSVIIF